MSRPAVVLCAKNLLSIVDLNNDWDCVIPRQTAEYTARLKAGEVVVDNRALAALSLNK